MKCTVHYNDIDFVITSSLPTKFDKYITALKIWHSFIKDDRVKRHLHNGPTHRNAEIEITYSKLSKIVTVNFCTVLY